MKTKHKYTKFIIGLFLGILAFVIITALVAYSLMIYPQTFADLAFENKMSRELKEKGVLRMADITDFDWDTMYYLWDGYMNIGSINGYIDDKYNLYKESYHDANEHLLFLKDGVLVKQIITSRGSVQLNYKPYIDMGHTNGEVAFTKDEAVFKIVNEKGYDSMAQVGIV